MLEAHGGPGAFLSMLAPPPTVPPEPEKVQQLVDMGFPKERAEYFYIFNFNK